MDKHHDKDILARLLAASMSPEYMAAWEALIDAEANNKDPAKMERAFEKLMDRLTQRTQEDSH